MDLKQLKNNFDLLAYLDDRAVRYWTEGRNVGEGWVNIQCPFCHDHSNHLGVSTESKMFHCWICGESGDVVSLVMKLDGVGFPSAKAVLEEFQLLELGKPERKRDARAYGSLLPKTFKRIEPGKEPIQVVRYMERRRFSLSVCQEWNLGYCHPPGEYQYYMIAPVVLDGEMMSWIAIDPTGKAISKYSDCPKDRALMSNKRLVYGIDYVVGDKVFVVEGPTDAWRLGKGSAVALMTKNFTMEQVMLLARRFKGKIVRVVLDADAREDTRRLVAVLESTHRFRDVLAVYLDSGDPANLTEKGIREVLGL